MSRTKRNPGSSAKLTEAVGIKQVKRTIDELQCQLQPELMCEGYTIYSNHEHGISVSIKEDRTDGKPIHILLTRKVEAYA